jgi:2-phosphosulfolactate phosphatase
MHVHLEWGAEALKHSAPTAIIVDCLSFSTAVATACHKGTKIYPFAWRKTAAAFAKAIGVPVAQKRSEGGLSLSPPSLKALNKGDALVLPSPNGSTLSAIAEQPHVYCGALRNAESVAIAALQHSSDIIIVAAGERWQSNNSLRPALEDQLAAGAIAWNLKGEGTELSIEAEAAAHLFERYQAALFQTLCASQSGQELIDRGFESDVAWAADLNASPIAPKLVRTAEKLGELGIELEPEMANQLVSYYQA